MAFAYQVFPIGDHAFTIELGTAIDEDVNKRCLSLARHIAAAALPGVRDVVPAYATVSVVFDPFVIFHLTNTPPYEYIQQRAIELIGQYNDLPATNGRKIDIPACFDHSFAPDLPIMAQEKHRSAGDIIEIFLARTYRVYMIGFLPGFAYMGKVEDAIAMPRKEKPHPEIKPGSIGIAGNQAGIYPLSSPGGWNIIGRTPIRLFDKDATEPCFLQAGDEVAFRPINIDEFHHLNQHP